MAAESLIQRTNPGVLMASESGAEGGGPVTLDLCGTGQRKNTLTAGPFNA
jgi:hypothetical protein